MCWFMCFPFGMTVLSLPMWLSRVSFCKKMLVLGMLIMLFLTPIVGGVIRSNITKWLAKKYFKYKKYFVKRSNINKS